MWTGNLQADNSLANYFNKDLIVAVHKRNSFVVKALLNRGADVNAKDNKGITAIMGAILTGDNKIVTILLDRGADVNAEDKIGTTPLMSAVMRGYVDIVKTLLDYNADINAKDEKGSTALTLARLQGDNEIIEMLEEITMKGKHKYGFWDFLAFWNFLGD